MLPPVCRRYYMSAFEATPDVLEGLLRGIPPGDPAWDHRPDADRFSLREVLAHLADWEPIWLERFRRTRDEDEPHLPSIDEGQAAIDHDYAHADPLQSLARIRQGRAANVALLRALTDEQWGRIGHRDENGPMTIEAQAVLVVGHDGYHTQEVAQWVARGRG